MSRNRRNCRKNLKHPIYDSILNIDTKKFICIFIILFLIFFVSFAFSKILAIYKYEKVIEPISNISNNNCNVVDISQNVSLNSNLSKSFNLCAIGDVICHNTQYFDAYVKDVDDYDFSYVFEDIKNYTLLPDITIGNLETTFAGKDRGYSNYPHFNSPDNLAKGLKEIGIDVLTTANNHCFDTGFSGLSRTIDVLDKFAISHLGTYKSKSEQEKILYKNVNGVKIAFINYTYGTNGIIVPKDKDFCVNLIDRSLIISQLNLAKSQGADLIVACLHWGTEYRTTANNEQKDLSDFLFKNGVDIIFGNHPHTLEPMEKRTLALDDGSTKDCFVIYALGNFISDQRAENTRNSIILNLKITKNTDNKISIDDVSYVSIHMYSNPNLKIRRFKLLDINKAISLYETGEDTSIGKVKYEDLKIQLNKIHNILGDNF